MSRFLSLFSLLIVAFATAVPAHAANVFLLHDFDLHAFDALVPAALGYDSASIVFFREMGTLTEEELALQRREEQAGCYPFYVMKDGEVVELGANCRTFFCVGEQHGPKQCRDRKGNPMGGVVEMQNRMSGVQKRVRHVPFSSLPDSARTAAMEERIQELSAIRCAPFFLMDYDVAVGEGYSCEEVGRFPYYSAARACVQDWRTKEGVQCDVALRPEEAAIRLRAIERDEDLVNRGLATDAVAVRSLKRYPDVREGQYGFTAIASLSGSLLAAAEDGRFHPERTLTRAGYVRLLMEAFLPDEVRGEKDCFRDVGARNAASAICAAKRLGAVRGFADGLFRPDRTVTKGEALAILLRLANVPLAQENIALPRGVAADGWEAPVVRSAIAAGLVREPVFAAQAQTTRADAVVWLYRLGKNAQAQRVAAR